MRLTEAQVRRRKLLMQFNKGLVKIDGVALIFAISVPSARTYKQHGIIAPWRRNRQTDYYDVREVNSAFARVEVLRNATSPLPLHEIGDRIQRERPAYRRRHPRQYDPPLDDHLI